MSQEQKETVIATIGDLVGAFLYYDRKEDEDLPRGVIEELIEKGEVTIEEIVEEFSKELRKGLKK